MFEEKSEKVFINYFFYKSVLVLSTCGVRRVHHELPAINIGNLVLAFNPENSRVPNRPMGFSPAQNSLEEKAIFLFFPNWSCLMLIPLTIPAGLPREFYTCNHLFRYHFTIRWPSFLYVIFFKKFSNNQKYLLPHQ